MAKNLPQNVEAEQSLLGTVMVYPSAMTTCFENGLLIEDFFEQRNQQIYRCFLELYNEKKPTDFTSLLARLNDKKLTSEIGGVDYLSLLSDSVVTSFSAKHYVDLIQEKSLLRKLILAAQDIMEESFENSFESDEVLDKAEKLILNITHSRKTSEFKGVKEVVEEVVTNINALRDHGGDATGMKSGYKNLDWYTYGFQKGELIILAARPSIGKTAFALNIAVNSAEIMRQPIAFFSLEMPANMLAARMLATKSFVDGVKLRSGKLSNQEWVQLSEAANNLKGLPIYIDDSSSIKVSEIFAKCRKLKHEKNIGMIIIDYLQLITSSRSRSENRQVEVAEISRSLKALAKELNVPVIALAQLSRNTEKTKQLPQLSDLRESGSIEQDADIVMFLYHEKKSDEIEDNQDVEDRQLIIAKNRNGPVGTMLMSFSKSCNHFYEYDRVES